MLKIYKKFRMERIRIKLKWKTGLSYNTYMKYNPGENSDEDQKI